MWGGWNQKGWILGEPVGIPGVTVGVFGGGGSESSMPGPREGMSQKVVALTLSV